MILFLLYDEEVDNEFVLVARIETNNTGTGFHHRRKDNEQRRVVAMMENIPPMM